MLSIVGMLDGFPYPVAGMPGAVGSVRSVAGMPGVLSALSALLPECRVLPAQSDG